MEANIHESRKISFFQKESLVSKAKFAWKTLVVLVLFLLLFAPAPTLALDYNNDLVNSYFSNIEKQLDSILISIKKLPNLPYENGQITLRVIDEKLEEIRNDAEKTSQDFKNLSDEAQKEYQNNLDLLNKNEELLKTKTKLELDFSQGRSYVFTSTPNNSFRSIHMKYADDNRGNGPGLSINVVGKIYGKVKQYCQEKGINIDNTFWLTAHSRTFYLTPCSIEKYLQSQYETGKTDIYNGDELYYLIPVVNKKFIYDDVIKARVLNSLITDYHVMERLYKEVKHYCDDRGVTITNDKFPDCIPNYFAKYPIRGSYILIEGSDTYFETELTYNVMRAYHAVKLFQQLEETNKNLAEGIVLTDKLSKLSDNLARRIKLAEDNSSNVKNYADELESFRETKIVSEIGELEKFVTELTNKLALAS
jgi:hypothetical protein